MHCIIQKGEHTDQDKETLSDYVNASPRWHGRIATQNLGLFS